MIGYSFRSKPGTYFRGQFEAYELVSEHGGETYEIVIFQTPNLDLKTLKDSSNNTVELGGKDHFGHPKIVP